MVSHQAKPFWRSGIGVLCLWIAVVTQAEPLSLKAELAVRAATFEVVMRKPEADPLTYEKPLPMELIPYAIRSDAFLSVGTAFKIGANQFVSAAHVLNAGVGTQYGQPALRDKLGKVYLIDQVLKYSMDEDFVVFSVAGPSNSKPLATNSDPTINRTVYTVGNALGEGIVIRDGLFTSETPEARQGRWKWIRFSAAASPGSSGGPLLDEKGRAIGVVLAVSPNENLNVAAPIHRVLEGSTSSALIKTQESFALPMMTDSIVVQTDDTLPLPMPYAHFATELLKLHELRFDRNSAELLKAHADEMFPKGASSVDQLHELTSAFSPQLILKRDGKWKARETTGDQTVEIDPHGRIDMGALGNSALVHLIKPDGVTVATLFTDSKQYMDLMLKALKLSRPVGTEAVKITSLGASRNESTYVDTFKRKWQMRAYYFPAMDVSVISLALPVPDGCVALVRIVPSGYSYMAQQELKMLASYLHMTYWGRLDAWREFLALKDWLPPVFDTIRIAYEYDKYFRYQSPALEFSYPLALQDTKANSQLSLKFAYFERNGSPTWDVAGVTMVEDENKGTYVEALRIPRPSASLSSESQERWQSLAASKKPYDKHAYYGDGKSYISSSLVSADAPKPTDPATVAIYEINYVVEYNIPPPDMAKLLKLATDNIKVLEH